MDLDKLCDVRVENGEYIFNTKSDKYYIEKGTYKFINIPLKHPMTILDTSVICNGNKFFKKKVGNINYTFYYDNMTMEITEVKKISVYCYYHNYMNGKNIFVPKIIKI